MKVKDIIKHTVGAEKVIFRDIPEKKEYEYDFGDVLCSMTNSCGWINIEDREWLKAVGERKVEAIVPFEKKIFISVY